MRPVTVLIFLALAATGCKQGVGERCQVTSDCEEDLICCVDESQRSIGGTCQRTEECELTAPDAGVDTGGEEDSTVDDDSAKPDGNPDAKPDTAPDQAPDLEPDTSPDLESDAATD